MTSTGAGTGTGTGSSPVATGRKEVRDGSTFVVYARTFRAPVEDVWAAVTEPDRLARWLGSWTGDPADGHVTFRMLYEGDDFPEERMTIDECAPPHRLAVTSTSPTEDGGTETWVMRVDLTEADGVTTLSFAQTVPEPKMAEGVGPGWDYYLDRMVAAETGGDPGSVDFDDYYPRLADHYRVAFADGG